MKRNKNTTLGFVIRGLIPYTKENIMLSFKPSQFFYELSKQDRKNIETYKTMYYRAIQRGYLELDEMGIPRITEKGQEYIEDFKPKKFKASKVMVIFDIPEEDRWKRTRLRASLKEYRFKQIQKSVWVSEYDCIDLLKSEIDSLRLKDCVRIFEVSEIK